MPERLPTVAGDNNAWGTILNGFLGVSLNADGTMKAASITSGLGYTPVNKAGDTGIGGLGLGSNFLSAGGVALGTNPASAGAVKLANTGWIAGRNSTNSADVNMIRVNSGNVMEHGAQIFRDDFGSIGGFDDPTAFLCFRPKFYNTTGSNKTPINVHAYAKGLVSVGDRSNGVYVTMEDDSGVVKKTITNMTRVGTTVTVTATGHTLSNGDRVGIASVTHTFNAEVNGAWTVANAAANTFDITVAGLSSGSYSSGGYVTNRPMYYAFGAYVIPKSPRGSLTGTAANADDIACYVAYNGGTENATDAYYLGNNNANFNRSVTNAVNNGSGAIRLTVTAHGMSANEGVTIANVGGVPNANGLFNINVIDANTIDLQGSTFAGTYTSGGTVYRKEWSTSFTMGASSIYGIRLLGEYSQGGLAFSGRFYGVALNMDGTFKTTPIQISGTVSAGAAINITSTITGSGINLAGTVSNIGLDMKDSAISGSAIRLPNNKSIVGRNNAGSADVTMIKVNTLDELSFDAISRLNNQMTVGAGVNFVFATSTGTKIGTGTTQLIAFHNATPVGQHSSTGETVGFTAGGGTTVTDASTFTGNVGSTAYRISDVVKCLKNKGFMAP